MAKEADGTAVKDRPDDTVTLSELQAKLDESEARLTERDGELEHIKQIQSGSDTKVAELQTVIDEMRKAQMTDEDRDKAERKQIKDEIEVLKTDLAASPQQVLRWRQDPVKAAAIDRIARGE